MNIYSFKRIPDGINKGYYCHPYFKRSDISMARKIRSMIGMSPIRWDITPGPNMPVSCMSRKTLADTWYAERVG